MKSHSDPRARKRPVNLTLQEDLVAEVRGVTDNLSGLVESLLADYLAMEKERRIAEAKAAKTAVAAWNRFAGKYGSFADEHSAL